MDADSQVEIPATDRPALHIPGLEDEDVSTLLNARTFKQYRQYVQDRLNGICPFCDPLDAELNKVIRQTNDCFEDGDWRIWRNPFPQKHTSTHLIIAPVRHVVRANQMTFNDWQNMTSLIDYAISAIGMGLPGGGVLMRFGDPALNAGSIRHLHVNIIVPDGTGEVRLPLAKDPKDVEAKRKVIAVFEKIRVNMHNWNEPLSNVLAILSEEELELVKDRLG